ILIAISAGMADEACDTLEQAIPQHLSREDWRSVDALLDLVPAEIRSQRPRLLLASAWVSHLSGRSESIWEIERQARIIYTVDGERFRDESAVRAEFSLLKLANSVQIEKEPAEFLAAIRAARAAIPAHQRLPHGLASVLEGWALGTSSRLHEATELMTLASALDSEIVDACSVRPLIGLMFAYKVAGAISECERYAEDVLALASIHELPVSAGWAAMFAGLLAYERNDLRAAEERLAVVERTGRVVHLLALRESMFCLAMTRLALGQPEEALATVRRLRELVLDRHAAGIIPGIRSFEARLPQQMDDLDRVRSWLGSSRRTSPDVPMLAFEHEPLTRARALLAVGGTGAIAEARRLVNGMRARAERANQRSTMIEIMTLSALVSKADRREAAALGDLAAAITLSGGDRYTRTFLDLGPQLAPLLRKLDGPARPEADRILALLERREQPAPAPVAARADASGRESILTVLTIREAEVMERLVRRLTNAEIAEELSISLQTVKSHAANIYGKLGVNSRREAIVAAEAYDLGTVERGRREPRPVRGNDGQITKGRRPPGRRQPDDNGPERDAPGRSVSAQPCGTSWGALRGTIP
ncbi:MAG: LuxR C-terminal-related transcriptional regulator, partial [Chloroflexota bacterium]